MALGGPAHYSFHGEVWCTSDDKLVLCEVACRTGGGEIRGEILELFSLNLNASVCQAQAADYVTNLKSRENWLTRLPAVAYNVGWVFVYPKGGRLKKLPDAAAINKHDFVLGFTEYLTVGKVYSTRDWYASYLSLLNICLRYALPVTTVRMRASHSWSKATPERSVKRTFVGLWPSRSRT